MAENRTYRQLTNLRTYILSLLLAFVGIGLLSLAELLDWKNLLWLQSLTREVGSLLIASVTIALIWELFSKRSFFAEALAVTRLVDDLNKTRLTGVSTLWQGSVDWASMFRGARNIKLFFAYGGTWRIENLPHLISFAMRPNTKAIVILPDPTDSNVIMAMDQRMTIGSDELSKRISEATDEYIRIFKKSGKEQEKLEIWYIPFAPTYNYYGFDEKAVFTLYDHKGERSDRPSFTIERGGTLSDFFEADFAALIRRGRKIFPTS